MGREGGRVGPQAKAWPPRTIFLAPALPIGLCKSSIPLSQFYLGYT